MNEIEIAGTLSVEMKTAEALLKKKIVFVKNNQTQSEANQLLMNLKISKSALTSKRASFLKPYKTQIAKVENDIREIITDVDDLFVMQERQLKDYILSKEKPVVATPPSGGSGNLDRISLFCDHPPVSFSEAPVMKDSVSVAEVEMSFTSKVLVVPDCENINMPLLVQAVYEKKLPLNFLTLDKKKIRDYVKTWEPNVDSKTFKDFGIPLVKDVGMKSRKKKEKPDVGK